VPNASLPIIDLADIWVERERDVILADISWQVMAGQRWVILGRNGCGKSTLTQIAGLWLHPSRGTVSIGADQLGRMDVRRVRSRLPVTSHALANRLRSDLTCADVVMCALNGALEPWWHQYSPAERQLAVDTLRRVDAHRFADRRLSSLSSGERQRVLLARALIVHPLALLLDEPTAALDLAGREDLITRLDTLADAQPELPMVLVTHHLEEIPTSFTHGLLMKSGRVLASGPLREVLTREAVTECFDINVDVECTDDRWSARARRRPSTKNLP
jgi:iron complex transport system ATP-binding protein